MPAVGGFVFDSSGALIDREIRVYRRDTGDLLGKTRSSGGDGDPHFDKVALLLHMDGADGSTTFTDSSPAPKAVTVHGDAKISTGQSKWGGASAYFSGNYSKLEVPPDQSLAFGTGDFTVECLVFSPPATGDDSNFDKLIFGGFAPDPDFVCFLRSSELAPALWDGSVAPVSQIAVQPSTWTHVAWCRASGVLRIFVNGQKGVEVSMPTHFNPGINYIGGEVTSRFFTGYIDDLRVTKGVARYTANFTPPAAPLPDIFGQGRTMAFGEYYFATPHTGEVNVVCLDDDSAPLENDLILRTFPV